MVKSFAWFVFATMLFSLPWPSIGHVRAAEWPLHPKEWVKDHEKHIKTATRMLGKDKEKDSLYFVIFVKSTYGWDRLPEAVHIEPCLFEGREEAAYYVGWYLHEIQDLKKNRSTRSPNLSWKLVAKFDNTDEDRIDAEYALTTLQKMLDRKYLPLHEELHVKRRKYVLPYTEMVPGLSNTKSATQVIQGIHGISEGMSKADRNGNGKIDAEEAKSVHEFDFAKSDANGDGELNRDEFAEGIIMASFWRADDDNDSKVPMPRNLGVIRDGGVDRDENDAVFKLLSERPMDINGDGVLEATEWRISRRVMANLQASPIVRSGRGRD